MILQKAEKVWVNQTCVLNPVSTTSMLLHLCAPCMTWISYDNYDRFVQHVIWNYFSHSLISQVEIACKLGKSLFLHEREAHVDLVRVLQRFRDNLPPVVVHCFTGTEAEAKRYIELGYYVGLTGFVCKPERGKAVRKLLKEGMIPLTHLVIETDAPFMLPPLPAKDYNGLDPRKRNNEPCTLPLLVKTLAELYGVSEQEVAEQTTANAMKLFQLWEVL